MSDLTRELVVLSIVNGWLLKSCNTTNLINCMCEQSG